VGPVEKNLGYSGHTAPLLKRFLPPNDPVGVYKYINGGERTLFYCWTPFTRDRGLYRVPTI